MNILFMGTPDFARESLKKLYEENYNIIGVVTNPDKPSGRGMKLTPSEVKVYALEKNLKIYQPTKVRKNEEFLNEVKELNPDLIVVAAYGKILPKELLDIPKYGCINVHGSLLPKYRGAAPIQWAVLNGDKVTGITTMFMDEGMDTGDILLKEEVTIGENETTGELWDRLSVVGANLLIKTIKELEKNNGKIKRIKQEGEYTLAPMLDKEMAAINWQEKDARDIHNLVRGLNPIMGAYTYLDGKKIKFWSTEVLSSEELIEKLPEFSEYKEKLSKLEPGTVIYADDKKGLYIATKNGILSIKIIQGENAKKMPIGDFLRGNPIQSGSIFE